MYVTLALCVWRGAMVGLTHENEMGNFEAALLFFSSLGLSDLVLRHPVNLGICLCRWA